MATRISGIVPLLVITLLCVGGVESGYMVLEYYMSLPMDQGPVQQAVPGDMASKEKTAAVTKQDYHIILQRNLFGLPPKKENPRTAVDPNADAKTARPDPGLVLMGTVSGTEGTDRAFILDKKTHRQQLYERGDAIQGAFLKEILHGKIILSKNGRDETFDMTEAAKMRSTAKPGQAAVPEASPPVSAPEAPEDAAVNNAGESGEMNQPDIAPTSPPTSPPISQQAQQADDSGRKTVRPRILRPSRQSGNQPVVRE